MASSFAMEGSPGFGFEGTFGSDQAVHNLATCKHCHHSGCDLRLLECGCSLHARCTPIAEDNPMTSCPFCRSPVRSIYLMPMNFDEIDEAKAAAASMSPSSKRGKKRKNATIARLNPNGNSNSEEGGDGSDLRTGRWTAEETLYCDKLIEAFEKGNLPISEAIKLNDFLANMLKSKQSRLTKKMKNARLSAKAYKRSSGCVSNPDDAKEFSELEKSFFNSIGCDMERAEIRFHMQKEWRELFSSFCVGMGQKLDADAWLSSVEEMDRRVSQAKDAARMARRKVMMGYALSQDSLNPERGVFIDRQLSNEAGRGEVVSTHSPTDMLSSQYSREKKQRNGGGGVSLRDFTSPFVAKVIQYIHRHQIPFEHVDAWVPSFIPSGEQQNGARGGQKCRLCFAGFASTESQIPPEGGRPAPLNSQERFDLLSFGEYSSKFSFDVGCGLPGRVYSSGVCSWEQGVANAPSQQFERCGGASHFGIRTVLGVPIPSPNVGRIVVLLYSRHDRVREAELVRRVTDELTKLMPTPKWKLVVDVGGPKPETTSSPSDRRIAELLKLLAEHIPTQNTSPYAAFVPGFASLRHLLVKPTKSSGDEELLNTVLESYTSYMATGRRSSDIAWMIARDFMSLSQANGAPPQQDGQVTQQPPLLSPPEVEHQTQQHGVQQQQMAHHQYQNFGLHPSAQQRQVGQVPQAQHGAQPAGLPSTGGPDALNALNQQLTRGPQPGPLSVGGMRHQPEHEPVPRQQSGGSPSQGRANGDHHHNGTTPATHLSPAPGFSMQQSAFMPIGLPQHAPATTHHP